jgi:hypothetical protein
MVKFNALKAEGEETEFIGVEIISQQHSQYNLRYR